MHYGGIIINKKVILFFISILIIIGTGCNKDANEQKESDSTLKEVNEYFQSKDYSQKYNQIKNKQFVSEQGPLDSQPTTFDFLDYFPINIQDISYVNQRESSVSGTEYVGIEYSGALNLQGEEIHIYKNYVFFDMKDFHDIKEKTKNRVAYTITPTSVSEIGKLDKVSDEISSEGYYIFPRGMEIGKEYVVQEIQEIFDIKTTFSPKGFVDLEVSGQLFKDCLVVENDTISKMKDGKNTDNAGLNTLLKNYYAKGVGLVYQEKYTTDITIRKDGKKETTKGIEKQFFLKFKDPTFKLNNIEEEVNSVKNNNAISNISLTTRSYGTVSVKSPVNWIESPIEGGDFGGIKLINSGDGNQEMSIITSGCAGCGFPNADTTLKPDPLLLVPENASNIQVLPSGLSASYTYYTSGNPYSRDVMVIIHPEGGFARVEIQLPDNEKSIATTVFNSFTFDGYR